MNFLSQERQVGFDDGFNLAVSGRRLIQADTKNFTSDGGVGFSMRTNILHGIPNPKKLKTRAIERTQAGSAAVDERLVDVEKE